MSDSATIFINDMRGAAGAPADCEPAPIHAPGHIQPHGVLVATAEGGLLISHVSANFEESTGLRASDFLGGGLAALFGPVAFSAILRMLDDTGQAAANAQVLALPLPYAPVRQVLAHRWRNRIFVELETPPGTEAGSALSRAPGILTSLGEARGVVELCDMVTRQMRGLTGFDRVLVYQFDESGHGRVVAETRRDGLPPLLHLRFPASDLPPQVRRFYLRNRVRAIPDTGYRPIWLLSTENAALDMECCALSGVAPAHLEYMANLGVRAAASIAIVRDDALWGMIFCHHMSPMPISADLRALCDVIGQFMSIMLGRVAETAALAERLGRFRAITALYNDMDLAGGIAAGLCRQPEVLLGLLDSGGAVLRLGDEVHLLGATPPEAAALAIMDGILPRDGETIRHAGDAGVPGGDAAGFAAVASGVLVMPLQDHPGDAIAWFRPEVTRSLTWAGDPAAAAGEIASPRKPFAAWREIRRGTSLPWSVADVAAAEDLRRAIMRALLRQAGSELARLAAYDPLTGLMNRRKMEAMMQSWQVAGAPAEAALLFLDLHRFKAINDTLGHAAGDECLVQAAARLKLLTPAGGMAGRLGGDEFMLFWPGATQARAVALAEACVAEFERPFLLLGRAYHAGGSAGVAFVDIAGFDNMMRQADAALYAAKRQGGGRAVLFEPALHDAVLTNMQIEQDLFRALEVDELEVHYQPIVQVAGRRLIGFEALARWHHPERGWISPAEFIPRAEEAGLIARLGAWVLDEAVRQLTAWRTQSPRLRMSVNISSRQLKDGSLARQLTGLLAGGLAPESLTLEVTESVLMEEAAVRELANLRALGFRIAVDDFGTGHSSLSYLHKLPVDSVKIDRSFVSPLGPDAKANRYFAAIVDLVRTLDLKAVAEGCETWAQWRVIEAAGCDKVQGWLVAPAMDAAAATAFIAAPQDWRETNRDGAPAPRPGARPRQVTLRGEGQAGRAAFLDSARLSHLPMTVIDPHLPDMPIVFANPAFERLTGYGQDEVVGRTCLFLQGPGSDNARLDLLRGALAAAEEATCAVTSYRKDGTAFRNVLNICPVFDQAGALVYFFSVQTDVSREN